MIRDVARSVLEKTPLAAQLYREVRGLVMAASKPQRTPFGFDFVGSRAMARGDFEPEETAVILEHLESVDLFVDVGANTGFYTCIAASRGKPCIAIEPLPENLRMLYRNLTINSLGGVEVLPLAVSDQPCVIPIYGGSTGASLVRGWANVADAYAQLIPASTIDRLLAHRLEGRRVFIKMDVEGAERAALAGASAVLRATPRPTWLVEVCLSEHHPGGVNRDFETLFELFFSLGYTAKTADRAGHPVTRRDVAAWVRDRKQAFGGHNFLFE